MHPNVKFGIGLAIIAMFVCGMMATVEAGVEVPQVAYSVKTGKPVYMEMAGKKTMVMPSTVIPNRHERIWVP